MCRVVGAGESEGMPNKKPVGLMRGLDEGVLGKGSKCRRNEEKEAIKR